MNEAFDKLTSVLDSAYGAPGVVLVMAWCIALGYFLKMTSWVKNDKIPMFVVPWGMFWNVVLRSLPTLPPNGTAFETAWFVVQHVSRLLAVGFMVGLAATLIYDKVLKGLEDRWPWLANLVSTPAGSAQQDAKPPSVTTTTTTTVEAGGAQPQPK